MASEICAGSAGRCRNICATAWSTRSPPATDSVVFESSYEWQDEAWLARRAEADPLREPMSVYEVHLGSWRPGLSYQEMATQLKATIGVNPLTDITAITIYNNSFEKDAAAIIAYAKVDGGLLNNVLAQNPDYKETPYGKHLLLAWTDNNDGKHISYLRSHVAGNERFRCCDPQLYQGLAELIRRERSVR